VSDLSELFEQLADGPVLLATAFASVDADCDSEIQMPRVQWRYVSPPSSDCGARE
jgi:hypothetical protein